MQYATGQAFRKALEDRLRNQSNQTGMPLMRLRKLVVFERFLARLVMDQPGAWLLKGGLALQWRMGQVARTTKDVDVLLTGPTPDIHQALVQAALLDLADWFRFLVQKPTGLLLPHEGGGLRFQVQALLDDRSFETFHVDVGWGDPVVEAPEEISAPSLLEFAGIEPIPVLCYPVSQHIAEKLHAYTRPHISGESSRTKDLVDILLLARTQTIRGETLREAIQAAFAARSTHALPTRFPGPPVSWATPFRRLAAEVGLFHLTLATGTELARTLLDPILQGQAMGIWNPETSHWDF